MKIYLDWNLSLRAVADGRREDGWVVKMGRSCEE